MCYLGVDKAIEDPSVCLRALPAVLVAPIIYTFALARGIAGVGAKGFPGRGRPHRSYQKWGSRKFHQITPEKSASVALYGFMTPLVRGRRCRSPHCEAVVYSQGIAPWFGRSHGPAETG